MLFFCEPAEGFLSGSSDFSDFVSGFFSGSSGFLGLSDLSSDFHDLNGDPSLAKATLDLVRKKSQIKKQKRRKSKSGAAVKELALRESKESMGTHIQNLNLLGDTNGPTSRSK